MSYTDLEYRLVRFHQLHRYDAFANPDKVGLGRCGCGEDMYYCEHDPHFARALIADLGLTEFACDNERWWATRIEARTP